MKQVSELKIKLFADGADKKEHAGALSSIRISRVYHQSVPDEKRQALLINVRSRVRFWQRFLIVQFHLKCLPMNWMRWRYRLMKLLHGARMSWSRFR